LDQIKRYEEYERERMKRNTHKKHFHGNYIKTLKMVMANVAERKKIKY
jgi:hypothetical protein